MTPIYDSYTAERRRDLSGLLLTRRDLIAARVSRIAAFGLIGGMVLVSILGGMPHGL